MATAKGVGERCPAVESQVSGPDLGQLGQEPPDVIGLLGSRQRKESIHLGVGHVGQQSLSRRARVQRASARVGAGHEGQAGRLFAHMVR